MSLTLTGKTLKQTEHKFDIDPNATIADLKQKCAEYGFDPQNIRLISKGKVLEDAVTISNSGIGTGPKDYFVIMVTPSKSAQPTAAAQPSAPVVPAAPAAQPVAQPMIFGLPGLPGMPAVQPGEQQSMINMAGLLQQNPGILLQLMASDPQLAPLMMQNPQAFQQLISNPAFIQQLTSVIQQGGAPQYTVELTEQEHDDIDDLMSMGFEEEEVVQYYFACDKNKEQTAAMLLDSMDSGDSGETDPDQGSNSS